MPPTLHAAFGDFVEHLNIVLHATITMHPLIHLPYAKGDQIRAFAFANPSYAPLDTDGFGKVCLYVGQECAMSDQGKLCTIRYRYGIGPVGKPKPKMRWDYRRTWPEDKRWCRHHMQVREASIPLGIGQLDINDAHTPTGYVLIEDIIRFCVVELGVPAEDGWHEALEDSRQWFLEQCGH